MCRIKLKIKKREECCTMRGNLIFGLVAGSMVGAAAAVIAMPYVKPQVRRAIRKGRRTMNCALHKICH